MISGQIDAASGRLCNMTWRPAGPGDVPLKSMPAGTGPWAYDAANQVAIPAPLTQQEKLAAVAPGAHVLAALALRLSASWATATAAQKATAQQVLDAAGARVLTALG